MFFFAAADENISLEFIPENDLVKMKIIKEDFYIYTIVYKFEGYLDMMNKLRSPLDNGTGLILYALKDHLQIYMENDNIFISTILKENNIDCRNLITIKKDKFLYQSFDMNKINIMYCKMVEKLLIRSFDNDEYKTYLKQCGKQISQLS